MTPTRPGRRREQVRPLRRAKEHVGVRRIRWLLAIYGLVFLVSLGQLARIQVVDAHEYADRSVAQRARTIDLAATRGRIYDRDGDVLATSVQAATVYADPRAYRESRTPDGEEVRSAGDAEKVAATLAERLELDAAAVEERLRGDGRFAYVARQVDWELGQEIRELDLRGIGVVAESERVYPNGPLAGQVIGFTDIDGQGLHGLELEHDQLLRGRPGMLAVEQDPAGLDIASGVRELVPSEPGTDLVITIDREIQHLAERAAADVVEERDARGAGIMVMDVDSGDVLGMASAPTYDPNDREGESEHWRNRTVTDLFEPGSTQKALTMAAALEEGAVEPGTTLAVDDAIRVGGKRFTDAHDHEVERWGLTEILERSSNVGTIMLAQQLGAEPLEHYLHEFGYGRAMGLGFPGESAGLLMPVEDWWQTSLPTIAIGHGVGVSLLQLASAYAVLANDGVASQPAVVRGTVGEDGRLSPAGGEGTRRVVSSDTAGRVRSMLETVVSGEHGTGRRAQVPGYTAAGKTGTARKPKEGARGYSDEYVASFVGFAPVDDPELVVAVMVDEPEPYYGGVVAAPVFSEVMEEALAHRRVPPQAAGESLDEAIDDVRADTPAAATTTDEPADP